MLMKEARQQIVDYGKKMQAAGLTTGTGGNLSVYDSQTGLMAISPSGIPYEDTTIEDVVIMKLDGTIVEGVRKPSSEHALHASIYKARPETGGVVHTHSTWCTTYACLRRPVEAVHFMLASAGGNRVECVDYATFGTDELARKVAAACSKGQALLLANHGMVAFSKDLPTAFAVAENVEWVAGLQWRAECVGRPVLLSSDEMDNVAEHFKGYGQQLNI